MDGKRFDDLAKRVFAIRLTRLRSLKGLAGGALAAVTGTVVSGDELEAKRGKHKARHQQKQKKQKKQKKHDGKKHDGGAGSEFRNPKKKKTICHCTASDPTTCRTLKIRKKSAKKHLKHLCDYLGACTTGRSGCPAPPPPPPTGCTVDEECTAVPCQKCDVASGACVSTCNAAACEVCTNNQCVSKCVEPTVCDGNGTCAGCETADTCPQPADPDCAEATCEGGVCGIDNFPPDTDCPEGVCDGNGTCVGCLVPGDCPPPADPDCAAATCIGNVCGIDNFDPGTICPEGVCNGNGICVGCLVPDTCPPPADPNCAEATCIGNVCGIDNFPPDTSCFDGNPCTSNDFCNGAGVCVGTTNVPAGVPCGADPDRCTDTCNGAGACVDTPVVCTAGTCQNPRTCNPDTGLCSPPTNVTPGQPGPNCDTPAQCCNGGICCEGGTICNLDTGVCEGPCGTGPACTTGFTCCSGACVETITLCGGVCGNVCTGTTRCCEDTNTCIPETVCCNDGSCEAGRTCCGLVCEVTDQTCCEATQGCQPNGTCCDGLLCLETEDAGFRCVLGCPPPNNPDVCEARYGDNTTTCDDSIFCSGTKCCRPKTFCDVNGLCPNDRECCAGLVCCLSGQTCDANNVCV